MSQANNLIVIVGRVGADPEMKYVNTDKCVSRFNVAVNRKGKDSETDWFQCEFWGKQAENIASYVKKGTLISVVGSARVDKYEHNGEKKTRFYILGDNFQLLGGKPGDKKTDDFDDDIPPF